MRLTEAGKKQMMKALVDLNFTFRAKRDLTENFKQGNDLKQSAFAKDSSDRWVRDALEEARIHAPERVGRQLGKSK